MTPARTDAAHPGLQPGWIDAPHQRRALGDLLLESGEHIHDFEASFIVHGPDDPSLPVALVPCAIGSSHHRLDFLIEPDAPLDPQRTRIIAVDAIGNGLTSSPSNSHRQPGWSFPRFTIRDMVRSQRLLLDAMCVERCSVVAGASMGGMHALQWGVMYPRDMDALVALTPLGRTPPWTAAINHAARHSLESARRSVGSGSRKSPEVWAGWTTLMQLLTIRTPNQVNQVNQELADACRVQGWLTQRATW